MTRFKAFGCHLAISVCLAMILLSLVLLVWFPDPYLEAVGGGRILGTLIFIDVVIGPVLTLIVYKVDKPSLRFDLTVIAVLQLIALCIGFYSLLQARPVYVAALGHRFDLIQAREMPDSELPWLGPVVVGVAIPNDKEIRNQMIFEALAGRDYGHFKKFHAPLLSMREEILSRAKSMDELKKLNPGREQAVTAWLVERGYDEKNAVYQGLRSPETDMAVILDAKDFKFVGVAPFKPWN